MAFWLFDLNCAILIFEKKNVQKCYDIHNSYFYMPKMQERILK